MFHLLANTNTLRGNDKTHAQCLLEGRYLIDFSLERLPQVAEKGVAKIRDSCVLLEDHNGHQ